VTQVKPSRLEESSLWLFKGNTSNLAGVVQRVTNNILAALWVGSYAVILLLFRTLRRLERIASRRRNA
jgi:hypothetical protein